VTTKAIIFDCDGTLVDSETLTSEVLVEMAAEHGLTIPLSEAVSRFRGHKLSHCIADMEQRLGRSLPPDFTAEFRTRSAEVLRLRLLPIDGALELATSLRLPFCVASSGPREKIELSLAVTGLLPFFKDAIFSSYEVGSWKPDPGIFLHAARALGARPADCLVVEDSLPGIQAGLAAGMQVVVYEPTVTHLSIPEGVSVIRHLSELRALLAES
jgi:HAD superfamily hydrolase (TIGR01509 family)